jgi:hypothetical protein
MTKIELLRLVNSLPDDGKDIKFVFNTRCYKDTVNYKDILITDSGFIKVSPVGDRINSSLSRSTRLLFDAELPFRI